MKKALILMTVVLLTVCLTGIHVYAKAQQTPFLNDHLDINLPYPIPDSGGKVIINLPKGKVGMIIQGMVRNLQPGRAYDVLVGSRDADNGPSKDWYTGAEADWIGCWATCWAKFATITTDTKGDANFHINIDADDLGAGTYYIRISLDESPCEGSWVTALTTDWITVELP